MFRMWCKIFKDTHLLCDTVIAYEDERTRTQKVFAALEAACCEFDLAVPIWFDSTVNDFKRHDRARFGQDHFIEHIDFDYLEIQVIEED